METDLFGGLDLGTVLGMEALPPETVPEESGEQPSIQVSLHTGARHYWKRAKDPDALAAEVRTWPFQEGDCYHCHTIALVDSMTWLRLMFERQTARYIAVSTYALYQAAVGEMFQAWEQGRVERIDFYLSDYLTSVRPGAISMIKEWIPSCGGRLVISKNHTKILVIEGNDFDVLIESSANMNEVIVPHTEQTCLTVSRPLVAEYIHLLSEIIPMNRDPGAPPYKGRDLNGS